LKCDERFAGASGGVEDDVFAVEEFEDGGFLRGVEFEFFGGDVIEEGVEKDVSLRGIARQEIVERGGHLAKDAAKRNRNPERFVFQIAFSKRATAARRRKDGNDTSRRLDEPAGFDASFQILTNFVHEISEDLVLRKNFNDESRRFRNFVAVGKPIDLMCAFLVYSYVRNARPVLKPQCELLINLKAISHGVVQQDSEILGNASMVQAGHWVILVCFDVWNGRKLHKQRLQGGDSYCNSVDLRVRLGGSR
jgi:hypothetical protein